MTIVRALIWFGVFWWGAIALSFWAGFLLRRSLVRLSWALAATSAVYLGLYRLNIPPPYLLRISMDVALAMGGSLCGVALTLTFIRKGISVLR